ncbi:MAG TPA: pitrilysin family protein [Vicinamibacterales bacterium]|nr:pitrilysin family protein [Vicinamibacterales bacterium]
MRTTAIVAAAAFAAVVTAVPLRGQPAQQAPPSTAGMVIKGKAPVSNEILKVKLPKPQMATLANGLQLMVLEDHRLPRVSFQIIIPGAGGYYDPVPMIGLSSYTAQMMREGTKSKTSQQISQALETMAANVNVGSSTSGPAATVSGGALTENLDPLFDLAADVLLNPTFPAEEWDRLKTRARAGLVQQRTQPGFLSQERFSKVVFGDHPAGRVSATAETLDAITRDAMVDWHRTRFVPDHALIAFAGDITLADARKLAETKLAAWKKAGVPKPAVTDPAAAGPAKVYLVARPGSVQTSLMVGGQSMVRTDPDYIPLTVANRVLGGTMGRLFRHLREEKGYTYGVGSGFSATQYRGSWSASTNVRTEVTDPALTDLMAEIDSMRTTAVPEKELNDAKRAIVAGFALSLETPEQMLGYYVQNWLYNLPADYWDTYPAKISAVTAAQAQAAAAKYWDAAKLQIVAVGDATKITDLMKKRGTLELYDADGKPMKGSQP